MFASDRRSRSAAHGPRPWNASGAHALERRAIGGRDDPVAVVEPIDPFLQQIGRLRQHEPRAARLGIGKRALDVVDDDRARRRRHRSRSRGRTAASPRRVRAAVRRRHARVGRARLRSAASRRAIRTCDELQEGGDCRIAESGKAQKDFDLSLPADSTSCTCNCRLLLRRRLRLVREEAADLLHRVVDLDVERLLAERGGRAARVAGDAVVLARRRVRIGACRGPGRARRAAAPDRLRRSGSAPCGPSPCRRRDTASSRCRGCRRASCADSPCADEPLVEVVLRLRVDLVDRSRRACPRGAYFASSFFATSA